jgi:hypothetical protein
MEGWHFHQIDYNAFGYVSGPMELLREGYAICYNRKLKGTQKYEDGCPTKELKWHSVDVRQTYKKIFEEDEESIKKYGKINKYTFELFSSFLILEDQEYGSISLIKSPQEKISRVNRVFDFMTKYYSKEQILKYCNIYDNILKGKKPSIELLTPNESLIMKQISKFPKETQQDWIDRISDYLTNNIKLKSADYLYQMPKSIIAYIESDKKDTDILTYISKLDSYSIYALHNFQSTLLDCYFICRSIKPTLSDPSILSIAYFGDFHIENISNFLVNDFEYELVFQKTKEDTNKDTLRCLNISADINIDNILKEYGYTIKNTGPPIIIPTDKPQYSYAIYNQQANVSVEKDESYSNAYSSDKDDSSSRNPFSKRDGSYSNTYGTNKDDSSSRNPFTKRDGSYSNTYSSDKDDRSSRNPFAKRDGSYSNKYYISHRIKRITKRKTSKRSIKKSSKHSIRRR